MPASVHSITCGIIACGCADQPAMSGCDQPTFPCIRIVQLYELASQGIGHQAAGDIVTARLLTGGLQVRILGFFI
jgi:hypothetical protein